VKTAPLWFYKQAGVIPYRPTGTGVEILLITSKGGHWIIPKGIIDPGETPIESACKEAYEEAGVEGHADLQMIGKYEYRKWGGICTVQVFGLEVIRVLHSWPEADIRQRKWFCKEEAFNAVRQRALKEIIRNFSLP
jgi:phosphohistidine phosphatase